MSITFIKRKIGNRMGKINKGKSLFFLKTILILLVSFTTISCKDGFYNTSQTLDDDEIKSIFARSEAVYKEYCQSCHENSITEFAQKDFVYGKTPEDIYTSISEGRNEGEMPSFKATFSDTKIKEMVVSILYASDNLDDFNISIEPQLSEIYESKFLKYRLEKVVDGLNSPWGMDFLPNGDLLVSDKSGELYRVNKFGQKTKINGVPKVRYKGQGGLMDVQLHPNFESNNYVYLSYSIFDENDYDLGSTAVSRFQLVGNELTNKKMIFDAKPYLNSNHHFGSRLEFDDNGYLFITIGDRGRRDDFPQDLTVYPGKVHRLHDDGTIPNDNPFVNDPSAVKSIYSYGHRNQQGMIKNPFTGDIWTHEHGPRGGDEVNIVKPGLNYGWPVISYGINYNGTSFTDLTEKEGMEQPLHYWTPSIAPSGMDFIKGNIYPNLEGSLLVGSLSFEFLGLYKVENNILTAEDRLLIDVGRVRNVKVGNDGYIYVAIESPGVIYKIIPITD